MREAGPQNAYRYTISAPRLAPAGHEHEHGHALAGPPDPITTPNFPAGPAARPSTCPLRCGLGGPLLRLRAVGLPLGPVLLDQALRDVLVLGADHSEHRRRAVLTSWNRAVLDRRLLARATRGPTGPSSDGSGTSRATPRGLAATHRRKDRVASAGENLSLYRSGQTLDKI